MLLNPSLIIFLQSWVCIMCILNNLPPKRDEKSNNEDSYHSANTDNHKSNSKINSQIINLINQIQEKLRPPTPYSKNSIDEQKKEEGVLEKHSSVNNKAKNPISTSDLAQPKDIEEGKKVKKEKSLTISYLLEIASKRSQFWVKIIIGDLLRSIYQKTNGSDLIVQPKEIAVFHKKEKEELSSTDHVFPRQRIKEDDGSHQLIKTVVSKKPAKVKSFAKGPGYKHWEKGAQKSKKGNGLWGRAMIEAQDSKKNSPKLPNTSDRKEMPSVLVTTPDCQPEKWFFVPCYGKRNAI